MTIEARGAGTGHPADTRAAIVLAGGASRRMEGPAKVQLALGDERLLDRVLAACSGWRVVIVGPPEVARPGQLVTREDPPYDGPVAGIRAGLTALVAVGRAPSCAAPTIAGARNSATGRDLIALIAADQPFLDADGIAELAAAVGSAEAAAYVDGQGRVQFLCAVWRADALAARLANAGSSMWSLYAGANVVGVPDRRGVARDVDTPDDLIAARAELDERERG